ncbi:hypothetical protein DV735_g197, partial [Chaetothyriales sp. CBS 134920]
MASPSGPLTPPAEPTETPGQSQLQPSANEKPNASSSASRIEALLSQPATSLSDDGTSKRPRDHRIIHLLLQHMGITAYQERIPLQLMDFAYRYTSSVLSDALHIQNEGYDQADNATTSKGSRAKTAATKAEEGDISIQALRMAVGSKISYQFAGPGALPKEFLKGLADERNRISLNAQAKEGERGYPMMVGGVKLPHEKYCLTGVSWGLKEEWDSEGEESAEEEPNGDATATATHGDDSRMDGVEETMDEDEDVGTMEDIFGQDDTGADGDGDHEMEGL